MSTFPLYGRVAWVTGAARGQGLAHARALAAAGAHVVLTDLAAPIDTISYSLPSPEELDAAANSIVESGGSAEAVQLDVRDSAAVNACVAGIDRDHGRLDIVVANAGICGFSPVDELGDAQWTDMIDTNLSGVFHCVRAAIPLMKRGTFGRIVGISSGAGRGGMANLSHYAASKWGLIGFLKSVAIEVGPYGITANVVCPTTVATPMVLNPATFARFRPDIDTPSMDDVLPVFRGLSPLGIEWLQPEDVTRSMMHLVADPGVITGTVLEVNLGTTAGRT